MSGTGLWVQSFKLESQSLRAQHRNYLCLYTNLMESSDVESELARAAAEVGPESGMVNSCYLADKSTKAPSAVLEVSSNARWLGKRRNGQCSNTRVLCLSPWLLQHLLTHIYVSSTIQIIPNCPLQLCCPISEHSGDILQVITCLDSKFPDKVLGSTLQVPVLLFYGFVIGTTKVRVGGDRGCAFEALKTALGFGLGVGVESAAAEEFVGGNAFLCAKFLAGVFF